MRELISYEFTELEEDVYEYKYAGSLAMLPKCLLNDMRKGNEALTKERDTLKEDNEALETMLDDSIHQVNDLVAHQKDIVYSITRTGIQEHKGSRDGSGDLAQAMMIADAASGLKATQIAEKRYPYKKNGAKQKYTLRSVHRNLAVKKPEDLERIQNLINDYPEVFDSVGIPAVWAWVAKKRNKGVKK